MFPHPHPHPHRTFLKVYFLMLSALSPAMRVPILRPSPTPTPRGVGGCSLPQGGGEKKGRGSRFVPLVGWNLLLVPAPLTTVLSANHCTYHHDPGAFWLPWGPFSLAISRTSLSPHPPFSPHSRRFVPRQYLSSGLVELVGPSSLSHSSAACSTHPPCYHKSSHRP